MKRQLTALFLFSFFTLTLTFIDFTVHGTLYNYGLQFSRVWAVPYWAVYAVIFQLAAVSCAIISESAGFFIFAEAFVLTSSQDLVFFLVWAGGLPSEPWVWRFEYDLFGFFNSETQILLSYLGFALAFALYRIVESERFRARFPNKKPNKTR